MNRYRATTTWVPLLRLCLFLLILLVGGLPALAANIVYLVARSAPSYTRSQIETAARFYGLDLEVRALQSPGDVSAALRAVSDPRTLAVVIDAETLPRLRLEQILGAAHTGQRSRPILIAGITDRTSANLLKAWSSGAVTSARMSETTASSWNQVAPDPDLTRQLGGVRLPLSSGSSVLSPALANTPAAETLMELRPAKTPSPTFVRTRVSSRTHDQEIFFAAEIHAPEVALSPDPYRQQAIFSSIAAPMIFLRYASGDRAWHTPGDFANFTIDDLWLREPYGHVDFEQLLQQSEAHNFHATIAFIPWNFDRSQPAVASLFRSHPDRLSICIHGNNHLHQEFGPFATHPLDQQTENIAVALGRMERFRQLTHIPYDAVMVFPHSIAPTATLAALKQANYLSTVNSLNVPSDGHTPADADFALRTVSLHFSDFPSLRRYSAESEIPETQIAIDAFLGNPMLFYAHESFFASGITAFNDIADRVNRRQPGVQWRSLGEITEHLFLERTLDDGSIKVRAYSSSIRLRNNHGQGRTYLVEKDEDFTSPLSVTIDGQPYGFERIVTKLTLRLFIPAGQVRQIDVKYGKPIGSHIVNIARNSPRIAAIRMLSDFRDNFVSNTSLGRRFIHSYVDSGQQWNRGFAALAVLLAGAAYRRRSKGQRAAVRPTSITH